MEGNRRFGKGARVAVIALLALTVISLASPFAAAQNGDELDTGVLLFWFIVIILIFFAPFILYKAVMIIQP
jgi:hypothetical protein